MAISSERLTIAGVLSTVYLNIEVTPGTQSIPNNTTSVAWKAWLSNTKYTYYCNSGTGLKMKIILDGATVKDTAELTFNFRPTGSARSQCIQSGTTTITHASDGTKSIAASVALTQTSGSITNKTVSIASFALTTIPRASTIVSFSSFVTNAASFAVNYSRKSTSFTHSTTLKIGTATIGTWTTTANGAQSFSLTATHKTNLLNAIPAAKTATATIILTTLSGSTTIGTATATATCTVWSGETPSVSGISASYSNPTSAITGTSRSYAIQNVTSVTITSTRSVSIGTSVASTTTKLGTQSTTTYPAVIKPSTSGTLTITVTVVDARGYSGSATSSISVVAYTPLTTIATYIGRPRTSGSLQTRLEVDLRITVNALTYGGNTTNGFNINVKTQLTTGGTITTYYNPTFNPKSASDTLYTIANTTEYNETKTYNVTIKVTDDFSSVTIIGVLSTAAYPLVLGDEGIGVGKVPVDGRALDVKGHTHIEGNLIITEGTTTQSMIATYSAPSNANELVDEWVLGKNGSNYPDAAHYWYVNTIFYSGITSSRKQLAYGYNIDTMYSRYYYAGTQTWSTWVKISN